MRFVPLRRDKVLLPLSLALLVGLSQAVAPGQPLARLDEAILAWLGEHLQGPVGDGLAQVYRISGVGFTAVLVVMALTFTVLRRWWRDLRLLVMASGGILILVDLVFKPLFSRSRPPGKLLPVDGHSFPSGHAAGSVAFYFAMVVILAAHYPRLRRPLAIGACLWVGLVWLSTLYVRAHWPTDLLAGGVVGFAWLSVCLGFWRQPPPSALQHSGSTPPPRPPLPPEPSSTGLADLRGLRSAPELGAAQRLRLRQELSPLLAACGWFTVGIMAPSPAAALAALRDLEAALGWPALLPAAGDGAGEPLVGGDGEGPVFLKGNQRNGVFRLRREDGLGEGILITGHEAADPEAADTWGPLPLDLFRDPIS